MDRFLDREPMLGQGASPMMATPHAADTFRQPCVRHRAPRPDAGMDHNSEGHEVIHTIKRGMGPGHDNLVICRLVAAARSLDLRTPNSVGIGRWCELCCMKGSHSPRSCRSGSPGDVSVRACPAYAGPAPPTRRSRHGGHGAKGRAGRGSPVAARDGSGVSCVGIGTVAGGRRRPPVGRGPGQRGTSRSPGAQCPRRRWYDRDRERSR